MHIQGKQFIFKGFIQIQGFHSYSKVDIHIQGKLFCFDRTFRPDFNGVIGFFTRLIILEI